MFSKPVVFIDIETTGGMPYNARVLEVAAIRYENNAVTGSFSSLVDPDSSIPSFITRITGITEDDITGAPSFYDISDQLHAILDDAIFIAHNVQFDYSFIHSEFKRLGIAFRPELFCTVKLSRSLYPQERGHSLEKLIQRHSIHVPSRHRAMADTQAIFDFTKIAYTEHGKELFDKAVAKQFPQTRLF